MAELGPPETIEQIRQELWKAITEGVDADIQFPAGTMTLEFQAG
ncbi:trypco2 family protein [Planobispora siamensis]|uniref:Trypsin-co-occurring domain-containing protein n=1 Tax=Planobispora siamensis TaxID=936338 RepID=A0A8J3SEH8_9ACTN|nr:trypco2 family protein [Planobispora siamensis]GIH92887.1 hypothetical protein Psi01_35170 [Planobispora siamensis]